MTDWDKVKCYECKGKCNKKGYPSVSKGSKYCTQERGIISPDRKSMWDNVKFNLQSLFMSKGAMRRGGSIKKDKEEEAENEKI